MAILVGARGQVPLGARWLAAQCPRGGMPCGAIARAGPGWVMLGPSPALLESVYGSINLPQL